MRTLRIKRFRPPYCLRSYRVWASQRQRTCWNCQYPIEAGDSYDAEVWICPEGPIRFCVHTMHLECPYGRFEDQECHEPPEEVGEEAHERAA